MSSMSVGESAVRSVIRSSRSRASFCNMLLIVVVIFFIISSFNCYPPWGGSVLGHNANDYGGHNADNYYYGGHPAPTGPALPNLINAVSILKSKSKSTCLSRR